MVRSLLKNVLRAFLVPVDGRRLALARILFGCLAAASLLAHFGEVSYQFSDAGWLSSESSRHVFNPGESRWSVLHVLNSPWAVRAFYAAILLAALSFTVGFQTRIMGWVCFVGLVSFENRNGMISYGGDHVLRVMFFLLALADCGKTGSLDAWLKHGRANRSVRVAAWPLRLIQIQVALIYFTSAHAKLHGSDWISGDALRLVLLNPAISRWDWSAALASSAALVALIRLATWATLAFELLFPALLFFRKARVALLVAGLGFHLTIFLTLDIHLFAWNMMACYAVFLPLNLRFNPVRADTVFKPGPVGVN